MMLPETDPIWLYSIAAEVWAPGRCIRYKTGSACIMSADRKPVDGTASAAQRQDGLLSTHETSDPRSPPAQYAASHADKLSVVHRGTNPR